jgi:hypothetical protein
MVLMDLLKTFASLCFVSVVAAGCATKHVVLDEYPTFRTGEIIVRAIGYDNKGQPIIGAALPGRPSRPGDHFAVVRLSEGVPVVSYDIAVIRQKPDFVKPLYAVYEWTGKGFMLGADFVGPVADCVTRVEPRNRDETVVELAIIVTPLAIGTACGFVVGLAEGIRKTALELSKVVVNGEEAITCTTYEYDSLGRLMFMRMHTPDRKRELVRTEFWYEGAGTAPVKTKVKSLLEGKEQEIK